MMTDDGAQGSGITPEKGRTRLRSQLAFIVELDRLKTVGRQSYVVGGERKENSAEHSWHVAMTALVLAERSEAPVDLLRVLSLLLVHDVVEIDAGDTYFYDDEGNASKQAREEAAAERIFGLLPADQAPDFHDLWNEYESGNTPEARFARTVDRLMPLLHNVATGGRSWREHGVTADQVRSRIRQGIEEGSPDLWNYADRLISQAVRDGLLAP